MDEEPDEPIEDRRSARLSYYEGMKKAAEEQFRLTEEGLRKLTGIDPAKVEKVVADVHKRHEKLLKRLDGYINKQTLRATK